MEKEAFSDVTLYLDQNSTNFQTSTSDIFLTKLIGTPKLRK